MTHARMIAVALIAIVALPAMAQQQPGPERIEQLRAQMIERFAKADTNRDGRLTRDETKGKMPRLYQHFDAVDTDGDGYVKQADIVAYVESLAAQRR